MKDGQHNILLKKILFGTIVGLMFLPMIQQQLELIPEKPLEGSFDKNVLPPLSRETWMNGSFQSEMMTFSDENIGFRNFMVRLYNQYNYSFFREAKANGVVTGKEGYLFENDYIQSHLGQNLNLPEVVDERMMKLQMIKDTLKKLGVDLLVAFAPGKASFFEEFLPEKYYPLGLSEESPVMSSRKTNYQIYRDRLQGTDIPFIDLRQWFIEIKPTTPYPLFPKNGTHWSKYGVALAADTLVRHIENLLDQSLHQVEIKDVVLSTTMQGSDDDIERAMNLLFDLPDLQMAYPQIEIIRDSSNFSPCVLTIGDSFYFGLFPYWFEEKRFWYYNQEVHDQSGKAIKMVSEIDVRNAIEEKDVVMIMETEANLHYLGFGFLDRVYDAYYGENSIFRRWQTQEYARAILGDSTWSRDVREKAKSDQIPFHKAVQNDAQYMVWQYEQKRRTNP